jgi:hypothetical protein
LLLNLELMGELMNNLTRIALVMVIALFTCGCTVDKKTDREPIRNVFNESSDSWLIQYDGGITGDERVYLAPGKAKFEVQKMGTSMIILQQPQRTVFIFNDPEKLLYNAPVTEWQAQREDFLTKLDPSRQRTYTTFEKGTQDTKILGLDARHYAGTSIVGSPDNPQEMKVDLWLTMQIKAPPELFDFINLRSKGLPEGGVPLRMVMHYQGKKQTVLKTIKAIKMEVPDSVFDIPMGFSVVPTEMEVLKGGVKGTEKGIAGVPAVPAKTGTNKKADPERYRRDGSPLGRATSDTKSTKTAENVSKKKSAAKPVVEAVKAAKVAKTVAKNAGKGAKKND